MTQRERENFLRNMTAELRRLPPPQIAAAKPAGGSPAKTAARQNIPLTKKESVPPFIEGDERRPGRGAPWGFMIAFVVTGCLLFLAAKMSPPPLEFTAQQLKVSADHATLEFDAINHTDHVITKQVRVGVGQGFIGHRHRSLGFRPLRTQDRVITVDGHGIAHLVLDFPLNGAPPDNYWIDAQ